MSKTVMKAFSRIIWANKGQITQIFTFLFLLDVFLLCEIPTFSLSIYTVEASNVDQGLLIDIRKKDKINMINVIITLVTIKPLEWRPFTFGFCFKQKSVQYGLSCSTIRSEQLLIAEWAAGLPEWVTGF